VTKRSRVTVLLAGALLLTCVSSVIAAPPAAASAVYLYPGQTLTTGKSINNGTGCFLIVQNDGNVVEYCNGAAVFSTATAGFGGDRLVMQSDGNLVVYTSNNVPKWSTGTNGQSVRYLALQDDKNLVLYSTSGTALWARSWLQDAAKAKVYAQERFKLYGWSASQFSCLDSLWTQESNWRWNATNPSTGAYGIPQSLPATKMATTGTDWQTDGLTQVQWGESYISGRYGTPCTAWSHEQTYGWY